MTGTPPKAPIPAVLSNTQLSYHVVNQPRSTQYTTPHQHQQQLASQQPSIFNTTLNPFTVVNEYSLAKQGTTNSTSPSSAPPYTSQDSFGTSQHLATANYNNSHLEASKRATTATNSTSTALPASIVSSNFDDSSTDPSYPPDLMPSDNWGLASQYTHKPFGRLPHQRESSLSSLGSAGPASPYSHSVSNPQIAIADSANDGFADMQGHDSSTSYYQLAKAMSAQDGVYPNCQNVHSFGHPDMSYPSAVSMQRPRTEKSGFLPTPDLNANHDRSHPNSVASSTVGGDSPATPSFGEPADDDKRRKPALAEPPKLDRTMTDIYSDELYNPNFTITSATPVQQQMAASPTNEVFVQRLNAANSQHLSARQSPASNASGDRSPFRQGSPLAPIHHDFGTPLPTSRLRFNSSQQMKEQEKAQRDAQMLQQQMVPKIEPETPKTISPKDAMLEFQGSEAESNFPSLFPSQESSDYSIDQGIAKLPSSSQERLSLYQRPTHQINMGFSYAPAQMNNIQVPQTYPFIAHPRQQQQSSPPHLSSAESSPSSASSIPRVYQKPLGASADSGTYTCTYHGCVQRFETPALLQKHKREGHRQPQGLSVGSPHQSDVTSPVADSPLNTQAGPHRCDRINPSTGKPCNTMFSRPYDLTRHEDTIHNARKQKVRCNLCTEEKTFSRADALTRHYRVCHPDVEFPGKYRRRGNN